MVDQIQYFSTITSAGGGGGGILGQLHQHGGAGGSGGPANTGIIKATNGPATGAGGGDTPPVSPGHKGIQHEIIRCRTNSCRWWWRS